MNYAERWIDWTGFQLEHIYYHLFSASVTAEECALYMTIRKDADEGKA